MSYTLGFSTCPNDTFIFDALANNKIDTEGLSFEPVMEDIETLNQWAFQGKLDITKLSFSTLFHVLDKYRILNAGSALGKGCGPLLVSKEKIPFQQADSKRIAIPGINTTANLLLNFALPNARNKTAILFSEIEESVLNGEYDMGLIIHESRFTYSQKGLKKVVDLGEYWEQQTGNPIPLAGISVRRDIPHEIQQKIDRLIRKSLEYAFAQYPALSTFITSHAQEMEESVMRKHIGLYVNDFSLDLGETGKTAIRRMHRLVSGEKIEIGPDIFV